MEFMAHALPNNGSSMTFKSSPLARDNGSSTTFAPAPVRRDNDSDRTYADYEILEKGSEFGDFEDSQYPEGGLRAWLVVLGVRRKYEMIRNRS